MRDKSKTNPRIISKALFYKIFSYFHPVSSFLSIGLKRELLLKAAIAELESERIDLEQKVASMHEAEEKMSQ